jgi:hypothetical protein
MAFWNHRAGHERYLSSVQVLHCLPYVSTDCSDCVPPAVGILAAQCAFARGASHVIIIDEHAYRLQRAQEVGLGSPAQAGPAGQCSLRGRAVARTQFAACRSQLHLQCCQAPPLRRQHALASC